MNLELTATAFLKPGIGRVLGEVTQSTISPVWSLPENLLLVCNGFGQEQLAYLANHLLVHLQDLGEVASLGVRAHKCVEGDRVCLQPGLAHLVVHAESLVPPAAGVAGYHKCIISPDYWIDVLQDKGKTHIQFAWKGLGCRPEWAD